MSVGPPHVSETRSSGWGAHEEGSRRDAEDVIEARGGSCCKVEGALDFYISYEP